MSANPEGRTDGPRTGGDGANPHARAQRFFGVVANRRSKWIVLVLWLVVGGLISSYANKLESVTKNEQSSYLPGSAESTKVLDLLKRFPSADTVPAVIVYHREGGLTEADKAKIAADAKAIEALGLKTVLGVTPSPPSPDGHAQLLIVPIKVADDTDAGTVLIDDVKAIRAQVEPGPSGVDVAVTGGAGFSADAIEVFGNINTTLLLWSVVIVAILLLITYRSPFLWLVPLFTVLVADNVARGVAYVLAQAGVVINGQTSGILVVLVFGAGTDYALLIVARYREELRRHQDKHEAMQYALGRAGPAILASGSTVIAGLLCLLAASLNSNRGLGPVGAIGIVCALAAMLTLLPALLVILPRGVFWPFVPRFGSAPKEDTGFYARVGRNILPRYRTVAIAVIVILAAMTFGLLRLDTNLSSLDAFRGSVESVRGQRLVAQSYPQGATAPTDVVVQPASSLQAAMRAAKDTPGVATVEGSSVQRAGDLATFQVVLLDDPYSGAAQDTIDRMRTAVRAAAGPGALVGGSTAIQRDVDAAAKRDFAIIAPLVLVVVFLILALLLRALVVPLVLVGTVILSFGAALGASVLVFEFVFGFAGVDASLPLLAFIFLVALGVDYNIFLMARAREETIGSGTRPGMLKALAVTGGVITSAGIVLAGTFSVLGVLPLVALTEIGFIVAFGVLLDTLVVRTLLVPALTFWIGPRIWAPGALARRDEPPFPEATRVGGRVPAGRDGTAG
jgi:RND superfamily putative drug exporter